jgi:hypothetical protein
MASLSITVMLAGNRSGPVSRNVETTSSSVAPAVPVTVKPANIVAAAKDWEYRLILRISVFTETRLSTVGGDTKRASSSYAGINRIRF